MDNYTKIDEYYAKLLKFEQEARENAELEDLFELERRNYKPLKECLSDLKNLKTLQNCLMNHSKHWHLKKPIFFCRRVKEH